MKKLIVIFPLLIGLFMYSCGDPSKEQGKEAAKEQNQNTTNGSHTEQSDSVYSDDGKIKGSGSEPANTPPK